MTPIIGNPIWPLVTASGFAFVLTISGTNYSFDKNSVSSSVANQYNFTKNGDDWSLEVYATATIKFTKAPKMDVCAVGGGGGGGGGTGNYSSYIYGRFAGKGGNGGGGYYDELLNQSLELNNDYAITIGSGGSGGSGATGSYASASKGSNGGVSSIIDGNGQTILTVNGGTGGSGSYRGSNPGAGAGGAAQYCFSDSNFPSVSGAARNAYKGGGGTGGAGSSNPTYGRAGTAGAAGLIVIRNAR